jgi:hypothetical protein
VPPLFISLYALKEARMARKRLFTAVLTGFTLALFACEQSMAQSTAMVYGSCVAPAAGLISWWPGDDNYNDIAPPMDETVDPDPNPIVDPNRSDDSAVSTTIYEAGMVGQAFRFIGVQDQIGHFLEVPDAPDLRPASFTVDLWAQRLGEGQGTGDALGSMLIQKAIADENITSGMSYYISWRGDGRIVADVGFGSQAVAPRLIGPVVPMGTWVHVALTVDSYRKATLYLDGAPQAQFIGSGRVLYGDGSIVIGNNWFGARKVPHNFNRSFDGRIDEVDLFNRALPATEIEQIYAAGAKGKCKGVGGESFEIDVRPGMNPDAIHTINMRTRGVVPVAILGGADFDVSGVDVTTLSFGPGGAPPVHRAGGHVMDVNKDGFADLVSHYRTQDSGLRSSDTQACVTATMVDGTVFQGCDAVRVRD